MYACRFVRHARIGESPSHDARPLELIRLESGGRANVRLGIESDARQLEKPAYGADKRGVQMLLAQSVEAGVTFDAFLPVDCRAMRHGIDVDRSHRANVCTVSASYAFIAINLHAIRFVASIFK
jgi:hypothetical protein